jgi:hypothetical protein
MSGGSLDARHLRAFSHGELFAGTVMLVAAFAVILKSGFVVAGWRRWMEVPAPLLVAVLPVALSWAQINAVLAPRPSLPRFSVTGCTFLGHPI